MANDPVVHVIDDDDAARDALQFLLSAADFSVRTYESAKVFLDTIPAAEAGCVITDVRMPEITGLELLRRLKTRGIGWPVIVITGQADVPVAAAATGTAPATAGNHRSRLVPFVVPNRYRWGDWLQRASCRCWKKVGRLPTARQDIKPNNTS
jgi:CheY-like chemotaxis protein